MDRMPLAEAQAKAQAILTRLNSVGVMAQVAGSVRRQKATVGDLDFVVADLQKAAATMGHVIPAGRRKLSFTLADGTDVQFFQAHPDEWEATLMFCTGNQQFNIIIRDRAKKMDYTLNQYGLWDDDRRIASTEREILEAIGMRWYDPPQREK